jgi:hypothetical protein
MRDTPEDPNDLAREFEALARDSSDGTAVIMGVSQYDVVSLDDAVRILRSKGHTVDTFNHGEITIRVPRRSDAPGRLHDGSDPSPPSRPIDVEGVVYDVTKTGPWRYDVHVGKERVGEFTWIGARFVFIPASPERIRSLEMVADAFVLACIAADAVGDAE